MSTKPNTARSATRRSTSPRRAALVAGWALITLALVHLATVVFDAASPTEDTRRALDAMGQVRVTLPGLQPTMTQLFYGFSLTMALGLVTVGTLVVLVARRSAQAPELLVAVLVATVVFAGIGLVLSWLLMPLPPLVGMAVALAAGLYGLVAVRRISRP